MESLGLVETWPVDHVAAAVMVGTEVVATTGPTSREFRLASITKPMASWATLVAVEEGIVALDGGLPGDDDRTLRHLLAHASGYGFDTPGPILAPERKRIYSNTGIEAVAHLVETAADMPFGDYLREAVFAPLGMTASELRGSAAHGVWSTVDDVTRFVAEIVEPRLVAPETARDAVRPQWPTLGGIVPGVGRFDPCPWGLGLELRGDKSPHWTGARNTADAYGHFGGSGTMWWTDPGRHLDGRPLSVLALTDRRFDDWHEEALRLWPELSDAVIDESTGAAVRAV